MGAFLRTQRDRAVLEYVLAGVNNRLFLSDYQLALPSKEDLQPSVEAKRPEIGSIE